MNHNQAHSEQFGEFRIYIIDKAKKCHWCDTTMEYLKMGPLTAYRYK